MPLYPGYSHRTIFDNIAILVREGRDSSQASAIAYASARRYFKQRYPQKKLPSYLEGSRHKGQGARGKNPVPLSRHAKVEHAAKLYESFSGHEADEVISVDKPVMPDVMLVVGDIDGILYSTVRDGVHEKYIHKFKKSCRPVFAVSHDGTQLFMLGGAYDFTERGIIDKS